MPDTSEKPLSRFLDGLCGLDLDADENVYYDSLDLDINNQEESHYLGSGAFSLLTLDNPPTSSATTSTSPGNGPIENLTYRQVGDPRDPVYFLRNPSKVYGESNPAYQGEATYDMALRILRTQNKELPSRLVQLFFKRTWPALPVVNRVRLQAACFALEGAGPFPHALLVGVLANSAVMIPLLHAHAKELWTLVLHLLDNEYRQPRLQTLQLALLEIYGRPVQNPGGNHTSICRALGAAQILGLHRDCSTWRLPAWELSVRKRVWWTLCIADKWNSFVYGRPSNILDPESVPIPTLRDDDWDGTNEGGEQGSISTYIATCRLTVILDTLLPYLNGDNQSLNFTSGRQGMALRKAASALEVIDRGLHLHPAQHGYRNLQLCQHGIEMLVCRLGLEEASQLSPQRFSSRAVQALEVIKTCVTSLETLGTEDYFGFWTPWSSYLISHAVAFLLRIAIKTFTNETRMSAHLATWQQALELVERTVIVVQRGCDAGWDVAEAAMPRLKILIRSMPAVDGTDRIKALIAPLPELGGSTQGDFCARRQCRFELTLGAESLADIQDLLFTEDWLTADVLRDFTESSRDLFRVGDESIHFGSSG
ncbi:hypothetical protein P7C73_g1977, partial [Tremellales sp. Uapishka_1]